MKDSQIRTAQDLDTAIAARAMSKHASLWKAAEGRTFRWTDLVSIAAATLMALAGLFKVVEGPGSGVVLMSLGLFMILSITLMRMEARMTALSRIMKQMERDDPGRPAG